MKGEPLIQSRPITAPSSGGENYFAQSGEIYFGVDSLLAQQPKDKMKL